MTLDEYLEYNCDYLQSAVKDVPSGKDLAPFFAFVKDDVVGMVPANFTDKANAVALFRAFLKAVGAEQYAIVSAAWYVELNNAEQAAGTELINREGTGTLYKDRRRECYQVSVGDRERSLLVTFGVERDYKGKIRRLVRKPSPGPADFAHGRMLDLLIEARH
jgi:hypothetical protein